MNAIKWADMDSDDSDEEEMNVPIQPAGLNDGTVQVSCFYPLIKLYIIVVRFKDCWPCV